MTAPAGIKADGIAKVLGGITVLDGISLTVRPSEIHALVGLNGAGKTTLMRILLGMMTPDRGAAELAGARVAGAGPDIWSRVGQMLEVPFAYPELTAQENVHASARLHGLGPEAAGAATRLAISALGLDAYAAKRARTLSLGNRQRVGLAAALVHVPDVVILDEPGNSLDPRGVLILRRLLQEAASERGATILVSSHHLDEVARMADVITVLHRGRIIGTLPPGSMDLERQFFDLVLECEAQSQERQ